MGNKNFSKDLLNNFKAGIQKDSKEEEEQEEEASKLDPLHELDPTNGLDFGIIDYGKCAFLKPCCKRLPRPCSCMAYCAFAITFLGGMIASLIIW